MALFHSQAAARAFSGYAIIQLGSVPNVFFISASACATPSVFPSYAINVFGVASVNVQMPHINHAALIVSPMGHSPVEMVRFQLLYGKYTSEVRNSVMSVSCLPLPGGVYGALSGSRAACSNKFSAVLPLETITRRVYNLSPRNWIRS